MIWQTMPSPDSIQMDVMHRAICRYVQSTSLPLYRLTDAHQIPIGTATLVEFRGKKYVVTASHIAEHTVGCGLGLPMDPSMKRVTGLGAIRAVRAALSQHDVAVIALDDPAVLDRLKTWNFVDIEQQLGSPWFNGPFVLSGYTEVARPVAGFNLPGSSIGMILGKYAGDVVDTADPFDANNDILLDWPTLDFDRPEAAIEVPRLQGFSGCSVWAMEPEFDPHSTLWTPSKQLRLVGIQSAVVHGSYIRAKRWHLLWSAFRSLDRRAAVALKKAVSTHWKSLEDRSQREGDLRSSRKPRTPEELIADLEKQIASIKQRAQRRKVQKSPASRFVRAALVSIDRALDVNTDATKRAALDDVRSTLSACLSRDGALVPQRSTAHRRSAAVASATEPDPVHSLDAYERAAIQRALAQAGENRIAAASLLGATKSTFYRRLKVLGIRSSQVPPPDDIGADLPLDLLAYEGRAVAAAIDAAGGSKPKAAKLIGSAQSTFYRATARHGL